jgi:hypothetical protein
MFTISNQSENARTRSRACAAGTSHVRVASSRAPSALPSRRAIACLTVLLHRLEQHIAALLANHFADQRAEHVHVFAQLGVFQRKGNVGARHGAGERECARV